MTEFDTYNVRQECFPVNDGVVMFSALNVATCGVQNMYFVAVK